MRLLLRRTNLFSTVPSWASVDPWALSAKNPHTVAQMLDGKVFTSEKTQPIVDPLNGGDFLNVSMPRNNADLDAFIQSQKKVPTSGLHTPIRNVHRYQ